MAYRPSEIFKRLGEVDYIVITASNASVKYSIYNQAIREKIPDEKIIFLYNEDIAYEVNTQYVHEQDEDVVKKLLGCNYNDIVLCPNLSLLNKKLVWLSDSNKQTLLGTTGFTEQEGYFSDYTRWRTFELVAADIEHEKVKGDTAELGVFRGEFSRLIHATFKNRKHLMFDTFCGFDNDELNYEIKMGTCDVSWAKTFMNTSVYVAMNGMVEPDKCQIRQGLFPQSLKPEDEEMKFAFVSIDVDFEESTYQGLCYFVPRMSDGGCIFIHDYNAGSIQRAIKRFEHDRQIRLRGIHLSDKCGTYIIRF